MKSQAKSGKQYPIGIDHYETKFEGQMEWNEFESKQIYEFKKPIFLLADSQLLFLPKNSRRFLQCIVEHGISDLLSREKISSEQSSQWIKQNIKAAYIGALNGDIQDFFEIFIAAMNFLGISASNCHFIKSNPTSEDRLLLKHPYLSVVLIAGGDPYRGMAVLRNTGIDQDLIRIATTNNSCYLIGIAEGASIFGSYFIRNQIAPTSMDLDNIVAGIQIIPSIIQKDENNDHWPLLMSTIGHVANYFNRENPTKSIHGIGLTMGGGCIVFPKERQTPLMAVEKTLLHISGTKTDKFSPNVDMQWNSLFAIPIPWRNPELIFHDKIDIISNKIEVIDDDDDDETTEIIKNVPQGQMILEILKVGPLSTNCCIYGDSLSKNCIIIDPGFDHEKIIQKISSLQLKPISIYLTHAHHDHLLSAEDLRIYYNIPLLCHQQEQSLLVDMNESIKISCAQFGIPSFYKSPNISNFYKENDKIPLRNGYIIHTPGHTTGSCCFYFPSDLLLFSGDTLFYDGVGRTDGPGGNMMNIIESIQKKLYCLNDKVRVIPGHGPETIIGREKKENNIVREGFNPILLQNLMQNFKK